jgi:hypothetical protein
MGAKTTKIARPTSQKYTLWTSPRESWKFPVQSSSLPANAEDKIKKLKPVEDDEQIAPFRTPVTPDVLEITVK